ncbi:hypothetical protein AAH991_35710 [Microbispora sp. ZYX-F-249]|uniref:Uncharacterized protein n=1 Tax=Microbispora maris TaxID=3144104 RepID=A0ABV0B1T4_9ACTN
MRVFAARTSWRSLVHSWSILSSHDTARIRCSELDGPRLRIGDRTILLAAPTRQRQRNWPNHRAARWPATCNPHLFVNVYTAVRTGRAQQRLGQEESGTHVRQIHEDRILHEATPQRGHSTRLCDLFGLSIKSAQRYTALATDLGAA